MDSLASQCFQKYGNINLIIANLLLKSADFTIFGGLLRDLHSGEQSNDIDVVVYYKEPSFKFDGSQFKDIFIEKIKKLFHDNGIELVNVERKIDVIKTDKYFQKNTEEHTEDMEDTGDTEDTEDDDDLLLSTINNPECTPDHLKYTGSAIINGTAYPITLDFSFMKDKSEFISKPSILQESFYIDSRSNDIPNDLTSIVHFLSENTKSFLEDQDIQQLKLDCKNKVMTLHNLSHTKCLLKVARHFSNGWSARNWSIFKSNFLETYQKSRKSDTITQKEKTNIEKLYQYLFK